jgi:hypothetical protein
MCMPVPEASLLWQSYHNLGSLSLENLITRAIFLLVILGELAKRPLHIRSSLEIRYPEYFRVKCYNGNSVRLWIISVCVKKYQQALLALLLGNGCHNYLRT